MTIYEVRPGMKLKHEHWTGVRVVTAVILRERGSIVECEDGFIGSQMLDQYEIANAVR